MYCHTSSSVQLLIGNTRTCSPLCTRALYRFHSSGRWFFGSHWPNASRKREHALLRARLLLVAARAADAARRSRTRRSRRAASPTGARCGFRPASRSTHAPAARSNPRPSARSGARPAPRARRSRNAITSGKLWPVSMCSSGNGNGAGRNAFSARRSRTSESLPPEKSSAGLRALARDFAQDVDRLGLEPVEMMRSRPAPAAARDARSGAVVECGFGDHVRLSAPVRVRRRAHDVDRAARCSPHSLCSGFSHHQRPARTSSPGSIARVQGAQPMLAIALIVQRVVRHVGARACRPRRRRRVQSASGLNFGEPCAASNSSTASSSRVTDCSRRSPVIHARLPASARASGSRLADLAAALAQLDALVERVDAVRRGRTARRATPRESRRRSSMP